MIRDFFAIPFKEIRRRKLRSWLTLIGVIIGIAAVVSLIMLGQGLERAITSQFDALGNDKLFVSAKGNALTPGLSIDAVKITEDDLETIEDVSGVKRAAGMIYSTTKVEYNDNARWFLVSGMPTDPEDRKLIGESQSFKVLKGRSLENGDKYKVVLGNSYTTDDLFGQEVDLGDKILINDIEFKVIGFWEKIGSPPDDQSLSIPLETYAEVFGSGDELGLIVAQVQAGENVELVEERLTRELRQERGVEEGKEDFSIQTPTQLLSTFSTILDIVNVVLIGIAAISLLVGGVGIMNTMYTTVLQRTKEIGIMKAVGAKNKHILFLFLVESGFYGLGGGVLGALFGIGAAKLVEAIFSQAVGPSFLIIELDFMFIGAVLLFSFLIGTISGIAPARRASKLNPVDSLRYE